MKRVDADNTPDQNDMTPVDLAQLCPPTSPLDTTLDREALGRKAREMMEGSSNNFIGNRPLPVDDTFAASIPVADTAAQSAQPTAVESEISARITAWGAAWVSRDVKGYLAFYSADFKPEGGSSRETWARQREQRINKANGIRIEIQNLLVRSNSPDTALAEFRQVYSTDTFDDKSERTLEWRKDNGQWQIVREVTRAVAKGR